jgi:TatD DNase family protein
MSLVDTHAHLDFKQFAGEDTDTLARAKQAGVDWIINVGTSLAGSRKSIELAERFDNVWASVGVHPHAAAEMTDETLAKLTELAKGKRVVAIGEVGFDQHYPKGPDIAVQTRAFEWQADIARQAKLPLIIHSRDAETETVEALTALRQKGLADPPGVVHCFTGSAEFADEVLGLGFLIGFTAPITYPKNDALREVVRKVPLDRIVVETDCPFLAPQDKRGERNEPAYVVGTAQKIAELKGISFNEVAKRTTANAERLFRI